MTLKLVDSILLCKVAIHGGFLMMKNTENEEAMSRLDALERKVSEIDQNIIRLLTLLGQKESMNNTPNGNSSPPEMPPLKTRRLRSGSVPTSAQIASIAHLSGEPRYPLWT